MGTNLGHLTRPRFVGCVECKHLLDSEDELYDHIEDMHHVVTAREGESYGEAEARFLRDHPDARTCIKCVEAGKPWARRPDSDVWFRRKAANDRDN